MTIGKCLCNMVYKVILKILATRLAHAFEDIISPMHNAFLSGRRITNYINLVLELLQHYGRKRASPRRLIKINFIKAFDLV